MAWTYGFFNSVNGDRVYNAQQMSEIFKGLITDGVYESVGNKLAVQPNSGMTIQIGTGRGWFNKHWVDNATEYLTTLEASDVTLNRYAAVCVRVDDTDSVRTAEPYIKYSEYATNPIKPTMERGEIVNEYCLAYIYIGAGVSEIKASDIEDTRGNTELCGWVTGLIKQLDSTTLFNQYEAIFDEWFEHMRGQLDEDAAGHLQNEIDDNKEHIAANTEELAFVKSTVGYMKKNYMKYPYYYTTRSSNGLDITDLGDGRIQVNGTPTATTDFQFHHRINRPITLPKGKYILNGLPKELVGTNTFICVAKTVDGVSNIITNHYGDSDTYFEIEEDTEVGIYIVFYSNNTFNNVIISPMIRDADIKDGTFERYIPNLYQLLGYKEVILTPVSELTMTSDSKFYINEAGDFKYNLKLTINKNINANAYSTIGSMTLPNYNSQYLVIPLMVCNSGGSPIGQALVSIGSGNKAVVLISNVAISSGYLLRGANFILANFLHNY